MSKMSRIGAIAVAGAMFSLAGVPVAEANSGVLNCSGGRSSFNCALLYGGGEEGLGRVIEIPAARSDEQRARMDERDRKWRAHCQPSLHYDRYGVARYSYKAPGCEFGRLGD